MRISLNTNNDYLKGMHIRVFIAVTEFIRETTERED